MRKTYRHWQCDVTPEAFFDLTMPVLPRQAYGGVGSSPLMSSPLMLPMSTCRYNSPELPTTVLSTQSRYNSPELLSSLSPPFPSSMQENNQTHLYDQASASRTPGYTQPSWNSKNAFDFVRIVAYIHFISFTKHTFSVVFPALADQICIV